MSDIVGISGIAHIALTIVNINKSKIFYKELMPFLGLNIIHESKKSIYFVGSKTGILLQEPVIKAKSKTFSQNNIGLHHFCFRGKSRNDILLIEKKLKSIRANIIRGPSDGDWAPGYFYILFEDPDGIRLEVNFVPKKGVLEKNVKFNPSNNY